MEKLLIILLLLIRGGQLYAQKIPDTLHVVTDRLDSGITKYYVIGGCKEMVVFQNEEKCDTSFYDNISDFAKEAYHKEIRLLRIRQKPISGVDADEVLDYFSIGDSITYFLHKLGNKKVHTTPTGYKVAFYNKRRNKNEIFEFTFYGDKMSSMSRLSANTLPTNDVGLTFQLMQFEEELNRHKVLIKRLKAIRNVKRKRLKHK